MLLVNTVTFPSLSDMLGGVNPPCVIAGPCAIENAEQMESIAHALHQKNIKFIRGGAYKPRTSPYEFQGLGKEGLKILRQVCDKYSLIGVSEILDTRDVASSLEYIDIIQIGSRNMQNTALLKEIGQTNHPVLLKRGMCSPLKDFFWAAEYIAAAGNNKIIMCERGIRTFEYSTRNTLDISAIAIIKQETSLPVIVDLSHSLGRKDILEPVSKAVLAAGADGIMVEVHNNPPDALCDAEQQLSIEEFNCFYDRVVG